MAQTHERPKPEELTRLPSIEQRGTNANTSPSAASSKSKSVSDNKILWSTEERVAYIKSLAILQPEEKTVLRFLDDALGKAPLPAPWKMHRDSSGRIFFANRSTGTSTWTHPLEPALRELAGVCRMCLASEGEAREATISRLSEQWKGEAKRDLNKWYSVKHETGKEYYCHRDTGESMWTHPGEVVMPLHYIKIQALEQLRDEAYLTTLFEAQDSVYCMTPSNRRLSGKVSSQDDLAARVQLEAQANSLATSNTELKELLSKAERDLRETKQQAKAQASLTRKVQFSVPAQNWQTELQRQCSDYGITSGLNPSVYAAMTARQFKLKFDGDVPQLDPDPDDRDFPLTVSVSKEVDARPQAQAQEQSTGSDARLSLLQSELDAERRRFAQSQEEWSEMSVAFSRISKNVTDATRAKNTLEVRLAALHQDTHKKKAILASQPSEDVAALEDTFSREAARREEILGLDSIRRDLTDKLRVSTETQERLRSELAAAQQQARSAQEVPRARSRLPPREDKLHEELKTQLKEAFAVQTHLNLRLMQSEKELHDRDDSDRSPKHILQFAEAQLAESREKFQQLFQTLQDAERDKGIYETKLTAMQKDLEAKQAQLSTLPSLEAALAAATAGTEKGSARTGDSPSAAVARLTKDLTVAKTAQEAMRSELEAARAHAIKPPADTDERIAALEMALAGEKRQRENLELELNQAVSRSDDSGAVQTARAEANRAKERATKAEHKLAKERKHFEQVWQCVRDAEVAKKALESRLVAMELGFKSAYGEERLTKLQTDVLKGC